VDLPDEASDALLALASAPLVHDELVGALEEICRIAVRTVPSAVGASLTTVGTAGPEVVASSDEWAAQLDELQHVEREGPCIDAARTSQLFRVRDVGAEPRWPSYMPRAHERGARSMVSLPMSAETKTVGALNLYSREVDAFDLEEVSLAEIIAGHASLATQVAAALHGHRALAEHLRLAMSSRAEIEQAKGIIMGTVGCDADTAFQRLVQQSNHEHRKVREIAAELIRRNSGAARKDQQ
jgi:GAF domain-containing protein